MQPPIKKYIKAVVPSSTVRFFKERQDKSDLEKENDLSFDLTHLIQRSEIDINAILTNPEAALLWEKDEKEFNKLLRNKNEELDLTAGERRALYYFLCAFKPKKALEIGTHIGVSALYFAKALQSAHASNSEDSSALQIDSVDFCDVNSVTTGTWKKHDGLKSPHNMLVEMNCSNMVSFHDCGAEAFMDHTEDQYDFIFLNGDKSSSASYRGLSKALKLLNKGGVILMNDVYPDNEPLFPDGNIVGGPWRGLKRAMSIENKLELMPLGSLPWQTKQGINRTSFALVTQS